MKRRAYRSMESWVPNRRDFVKVLGSASVMAGGVVLGGPALGQTPPPAPLETNLDQFLKVPRTKHSVPGAFAGKVVRVTNPRSLVEEKFDAAVIDDMVRKGIASLTGKDLKDSYKMLFEPDDVIGIKVNPVGPPLIQTRPEVVDAVIRWLTENGVKKSNIIIWDRFDYMLRDAGYVPDRFPGIAIEGLQTMDEDEKGTKWRDKDGNHVSANNFDKDVYFHVKGFVGKGVKGYPSDEFYQNQHVFVGEDSYFGKLLTKRLTKIINVAAYKNTGPNVSMATKCIGYASLCNTGRLHAPMGLKLSTAVIAIPVVRDKLVLNIIDGIRAQYDGGPDKNAQFVYANHSLYFATDPFALDMTCHNELAAKRRAMGVTVNDSPRLTEYLRWGEELGLGVADPAKIKVVTV